MYMDKLFQLDLADDMPEYIYLNHHISVEMVGCAEDVRNMHKDTRKVLISEIISNAMNEIIFVVNIVTYLPPCKIPKKKSSIKLHMDNVRQEVHPGRNLDNQDRVET